MEVTRQGTLYPAGTLAVLSHHPNVPLFITPIPKYDIIFCNFVHVSTRYGLMHRRSTQGIGTCAARGSSPLVRNLDFAYLPDYVNLQSGNSSAGRTIHGIEKCMYRSALLALLRDLFFRITTYVPNC